MFDFSILFSRLIPNISKYEIAGLCALKARGLTLFDMNCINLNNAFIKMYRSNCFNIIYTSTYYTKMFHIARKADKKYVF